MALFKVEARDGSVSLIVRARCISCARQAAVSASPAKETMLWRDSSKSSVKVIYNTSQTPYDPDGKRCVLERMEYEV